ncbi:MAG TPA: hypothetical protein DC049_07950, partial [Spirochaetia bacterium]|nr:hypothetical protein [Spirochaetia bacterium]
TYQFAEGTVKFIDESMEEVEVGKEMYCKVTRVFHIRADDLKWKRRVLDEGYTVITGSNIKPAAESAKAQRIKTRELSDSTLPFQNNMDEEDYNPYIETPTSEPTLLDGSGGILAHGGTPVYLEKETLTAKSYTGIV